LNVTCPIQQIIMASQMEPKCCDIMCYAYWCRQKIIFRRMSSVGHIGAAIERLS
jgi:hypothetical protein